MLSIQRVPPPSPPAYFASAISALDDDSATSLDSTAISALLTFLSIGVLVMPKGGNASGKAKEAVEVVVRKEELGVASLRSGIKCFWECWLFSFVTWMIGIRYGDIAWIRL